MAKSADSGQMPRSVASDMCLHFAQAFLSQYLGLLRCSAASDLGLHCLLRPVCLNI